MSLNKQTLLLDKDATLLDSCDSLFVTHDFINEDIIPHFPFLESIFKELLQQLKCEHTITFSGVSTKHIFLPGYYDYIFNLIPPKQGNLIQWQIVDATDTYNSQKRHQQTYQENIIASNRRSNRNQS